VYTKPASNGTIPTASQNPPPFRIAPVNSQLINAVVRRPRDPRLRKLEDQESTTPASNVTAAKEVKVPSAPTPIDTKNDKQNGLYISLFRVKSIMSVISVRKYIVLYKYKIPSSVELVINSPVYCTYIYLLL